MITRRELLKGALVTAAATILPIDLKAARRKRALRIAHLTDIHVQPELNAGPGMAHALKHAHNLKDKPNLILTGGDLIMDCFATGYDRAKLQWDLFMKVLGDNTNLPAVHCIGNHDVWGWDKREGSADHASKAIKKWATDLLKMPRPYMSVERSGWKLIVLDSTHPNGAGYIGKLDEEQFDWLKQELERTPARTPILILSHIPILCASAYFDGDLAKGDNWQVPGAWMHIDARRIVELFVKHPNVKVCLSGHIHQYDKVEYRGITFLCNGAVSGAWWKGDYIGTPPGYGVIDLYDDGTVENQYVLTGWKAAS